MAKRIVKRAAKLTAIDKRLDFRTVSNPAAWHADGHGDAPPYHDQHADGGTYYDHPDSEHNDVHIDEGGKRDVFRGDPAELVSQSIERLQRVLNKFERGYQKRLLTLENRLAALEARSKHR